MTCVACEKEKLGRQQNIDLRGRGYGMRGRNAESAVTLVREVLLRYISRSFLAPARAFSQLSSTLSPQLSHQ